MNRNNQAINQLKSIVKIKFTPGIIGLITGSFGLFILFRSLIVSPSKDVLWLGNFDTNLMVWIVEWGYHILFEKWAWNDLWNANQFFPHIGSLAFSDSIISAQIFYGPLRLLGFNPLPALYTTFAFFILVGCMLSDWALILIGDIKNYEKAIIIYVAHFSLPMVTFLGHYQFFGFQLAPPFFLFLYLLLRDGGGFYLILLSLLFAVATGFSTYFAPMSIGVIFGLIIFMAFKRTLIVNFRRIYNSMGWTSIAISLSIALILFFIQIKPYLNLFHHLPKQDWNSISKCSALPWSFLLHPSLRSWLYPSPGVTWGYWEKCYFPGVLLILGTAYNIYAQSTKKRSEYHQRNGNNSVAVMTLDQYSMAVFVIAYLLSLGPFIRFDFINISGKIYLPFAAMAKILPGFDNIRAPGRFGMFLGLSLGVFMVTTIRMYFLSRFGVKLNKFTTKFVIFILMIGIMVDNGLETKLFPYRIENRKFYEVAKNLIDDHEPILILPLSVGKHLDTIRNYMEQLKGSTIHHGWLVSGYGARDTLELKKLNHLDHQFQRGAIPFDILLGKAREFKVEKLVVFTNNYSVEQITEIKSLASKELRLLFETDQGTLWKILPKI